MNIDELIQIYEKEKNLIINRIAVIINDWKQSEKTVDDLVYLVEKYFGNTWIEDEKEYERVYEIWNTFKNTEISNLPGMTMNERLWTFGLLEKYDQLKTDNDKIIIYKKLKAKI